jgi:hypothetical protein
LIEFNLCYNALARGGEHLCLYWDEARWDYFFDAPDFEWKLQKQLDLQVMLFFHDLEHYCLCVFFSFGLYFLMRGLKRDGVSEARSPYVFLYLHDTKKAYVATRLTNAIRAHIPSDERKKHFGSQSLWKGKATDLHIHPDLTMEHRIARGGWTTQTSNRNAEGYLESTPIMNAPGGKAASGAQNCHAPLYPALLESLGFALGEEGGPVHRLLDKMFTTDVTHLQPAGTMRPWY